MKKGKKLLLSCIAVCFICLTAIVGVSARVAVYTAETTSSVHSYSGVKQYYKINAECQDFGVDRAVNTWTYNWYASGQSSSLRVYGEKVTKTSTGNYKVYYTGYSNIGSKRSPCSATLSY